MQAIANLITTDELWIRKPATREKPLDATNSEGRRPRQIEEGLSRRARPKIGSASQKGSAERAERWRFVSRGKHNILDELLPEAIGEGDAMKEGLKEENADGIEIGGGCRRLAREDLRRHRGKGPRGFAMADGRRETKVDEARATARLHEDIVWLDVPMDDPALVEKIEGAQERRQGLQDLREIAPPPPRRQALALDQLADEDRPPSAILIAIVDRR